MTKLIHKFVKGAPERLEEGILYVSIEYACVLHKCCCGCGSEVVTRLSPKDWRMTFDGESISLYPSIGNWKLKCQSHYWIKNNRVVWARKWSADEIRDVDEAERLGSQQYYKGKRSDGHDAPDQKVPGTGKKGLRTKLKRFIGKRLGPRSSDLKA